MSRKTEAYFVWAPAILAVLIVALLPSLTGGLTTDSVSAQDTAVASSPIATATAMPATVGSATNFDAQQAAYALEARVIEIYDDASPSVVNITSRTYIRYGYMGTVPEEGTGSGFIYDTDGYIVTNYHVVEAAEELLVTLADGRVYDAQVVGADPTNDLAVLYIDANVELPAPLRVGDSTDLQVGQFVVAIGNPFGLDQTLTTGVVSALGRVIESPEDNRFIGEAIQTDAAINPGNSGGPLLDLQGRLIGVNSQIISPSGASSGIGFAVSSATVQRVVPQLISRGYYAHPWLGADLMPLTPAIVEVLRQADVIVPVDQGLQVYDTQTGSPAANAGIRGASGWVRVGRRSQLPVGGDILTAIDDQPIGDLQDLTIYLEMETAIGDTVELTILRDGKEMRVAVKLTERPQE